ncbi:MAG: GH31, partial [uncultured Solirubrobacteraceae bacterium]
DVCSSDLALRPRPALTWPLPQPVRAPHGDGHHRGPAQRDAGPAHVRPLPRRVRRHPALCGQLDGRQPLPLGSPVAEHPDGHGLRRLGPGLRRRRRRRVPWALQCRAVPALDAVRGPDAVLPQPLRDRQRRPVRLVLGRGGPRPRPRRHRAAIPAVALHLRRLRPGLGDRCSGPASAGVRSSVRRRRARHRRRVPARARPPSRSGRRRRPDGTPGLPPRGRLVRLAQRRVGRRHPIRARGHPDGPHPHVRPGRRGHPDVAGRAALDRRPSSRSDRAARVRARRRRNARVDAPGRRRPHHRGGGGRSPPHHLHGHARRRHGEDRSAGGRERLPRVRTRGVPPRRPRRCARGGEPRGRADRGGRSWLRPAEFRSGLQRRIRLL